MSARKQRKIQQSKKNLFEIYGILLISAAIYIFISVYYKSENIIPSTIRNILKGLTGFGGFIVPFLIFIVGIGLIVKQDRLTFKLKFYALCFLFIFFLIFIEIHPSISMGQAKYIDRIFNAYENGMLGYGGGALGEAIAYPIVMLLGMAGTYIFTGAFILINLLIVTNASVYNIVSAIKSKTKAGFNSLSGMIHKIADKNKNREKPHDIKIECKESNNEKEKYIDEINKKIKILDFLKDSQTPPAEADEVTCDAPIEENVSPSKSLDGDAANKASNINHDIEMNKNSAHKQYSFPPLSLLNIGSGNKNYGDKKDLINNAKILEETLESFGVEARVVQVNRGPVITRYELQPSPGVKVSKIVNLSDDIALNLAAPAVRIEAPIPGKAAVGIEVPNKEMSMVYLREIIESKEFIDQKSPLTFALGKDVAGNSIVSDLSEMPHLLIAGATGSGKSVCVNSLITSILYKSDPEKVKLLLIDPKVVELSTYNGIPHLLIPVVTDPKKAAGALAWAVQEMNNRYKLFADNNVRNIESYNGLMEKKSPEGILPKIVIIIDELSDLMMAAPNDVEDSICRLAQMARAAGMHLVVATQRPSVDVLTGVIKANIPSRISFAVSSQIDSRTILDMAGAEKLLGKGDMLYYPVGASKPLRIQGAFVSEKEVEQVVGYIKSQTESEYKDDIIDEIENKGPSSDENPDELLPQAIEIVLDAGQASISLLQRRMRIGYNRAARLIDSMEERGIIGGYEGSKPRQVLITKQEYENMM